MPQIINCKITKINECNDKIKKYTLELSKCINFEPGQYLQLSLEQVTASELWPDSRAFSIASFSSKSSIEIYIKRTGSFTSLIHEHLKLGDEVSVKLPYGDFTLPKLNDSVKIVCLSNGVGITPFLSFIDYLEEQGKIDNLCLLHTFRFQTDLIGVERIKKISDNNLNLFITGSHDERYINRRMLASDILKFNFDKDTLFYISGSKSYIDDVELMLKNLGYDKISKDIW